MIERDPGLTITCSSVPQTCCFECESLLGRILNVLVDDICLTDAA